MVAVWTEASKTTPLRQCNLAPAFRAANRTVGCAVNTLVWSALPGHCRAKGIEPTHLRRTPNCKGLEAPRALENIIKTVIDCRALARPTRFVMNDRLPVASWPQKALSPCRRRRDACGSPSMSSSGTTGVSAATLIGYATIPARWTRTRRNDARMMAQGVPGPSPA
jgi:hypothetical protein